MKRVGWCLEIALVAVGLTGCGDFSIGKKEYPTVAVAYSLDAVKQISPTITDGDDPQTYGQARYDVGPGSRLLLRYESFSTYTDKVDVSGTKKVKVQLTVESDPSEARTRLKLCPLLADWMMLATWRSAHPFGPGGQWQTQGADFETPSCVSAEAVPASPDPDYKPEELIFDMTKWFVDFPRGRGINYGWVVTATSDVRLVGETSGAHSPRVFFEKFLGF